MISDEKKSDEIREAIQINFFLSKFWILTQKGRGGWLWPKIHVPTLILIFKNMYNFFWWLYDLYFSVILNWLIEADS